MGKDEVPMPFPALRENERADFVCQLGWYRGKVILSKNLSPLAIELEGGRFFLLQR